MTKTLKVGVNDSGFIKLKSLKASDLLETLPRDYVWVL